MHKFVHEYCFLVHYSLWEGHPFQLAKSSSDGVSIGLSRIDLMTFRHSQLFPGFYYHQTKILTVREDNHCFTY